MLWWAGAYLGGAFLTLYGAAAIGELTATDCERRPGLMLAVMVLWPIVTILLVGVALLRRGARRHTRKRTKTAQRAAVRRELGLDP